MQNPQALAGARGAVWRVDRVETFGARGAPRLLHLSSRQPRGTRTLIAIRPHEPAAWLPPDDALRPVTPREAAALVSMTDSAARGAFTLSAAERLQGDIHAWQLAPALAFERGFARVLAADAAGTGKTVAAAIAIAQCLDEGVDRRCLVLTPAHLLSQWRAELRDRMSIEGTVLDSAALRALQSRIPAGVSPWSLPGCLIASLDFFKQPHIAASIRPLIWDLVVIDEAHLACGASERHLSVDRVARQSRRVLLLTATPSDGAGEKLRALRALGSGAGPDPLIALRHVAAGRRRVERVVTIVPDQATAALHERLDAYLSWITAGRTEGPAALLATLLVKRALSSTQAVYLSLQRRLALLAQAQGPGQPSLFDVEEDPAVLGAASGRPLDDERRRLRSLIDLARDAARSDRRLDALGALVRRSREPLLIFSCFRDTAAAIFQSLSAHAPALLIHGALPPAAIDAALDAFTHGNARLLVATDVASQGLNLHRRCRWVLHYDLPWRPSIIEQRTGRVDRLGQRLRVHATFLLDRTPLAAGMHARIQVLADRMRDDERVEGGRWTVLAAAEARRLASRRGTGSNGAGRMRIAGPVTVVDIECRASSGFVIDRRVVGVAADPDRARAWAADFSRRLRDRLRRPLAARGRRRIAREQAVLGSARASLRTGPGQAGLFERRAERERAGAAEARALLTTAADAAIARHRAESRIAAAVSRTIASFLFPPP